MQSDTAASGKAAFLAGDSSAVSRSASTLVFVIAAYIAAQMLADVASLKIGVVAGLAVDMGTFIYPVTFTLRDVAHRVLGKRATQQLVFAAGAINVVMALYLRWCAVVPGDPAWGLAGPFAAIFAAAGLARIVIASIVAELVSELADTEVYHWFVTRVTRRHVWARVAVSNAVAIPLDNLVFCVGAFGWSLPWPVVGQIFVSNLAVKAAVTVLSIPLIYAVREGGAARGTGPAAE